MDAFSHCAPATRTATLQHQQMACMLRLLLPLQSKEKKRRGRKEKVTAEMRRQARKAREEKREEKAMAARKEREEIFEVRGCRVVQQHCDHAVAEMQQVQQ